MDFHSMKRKALQALCKKHNLPANGTNLKMADALSALLNQACKEIVPRAPSRMKGSGGGPAAQAGEEVLVSPKAVVRAPKKVRFLLQEEIPDGYVSQGKRKMRRISSQIRPEAEEDGARSRKDKGHGSVEEEQETSVRTTRSRARKSLVGDVAQFPIVEKRKTRRRSDLEIDEETENLRSVKARTEVGESKQPRKANELTEMHPPRENATRRSQRDISKLKVSAPADAVTQKDEIARIPLTITAAKDIGLKSRKKGINETVEEEELLVMTTRSRARKALVGGVTQFPIAEKRNTRRSESLTDGEKNVDGNQEEKRNPRKGKANREVGEGSSKDCEIKGDNKNSQQPDKADPLTEIHFQQDKGSRLSTRNASKLAVSVPADAEIQKNKVAGALSKIAAEAEETGTKCRKKESDETVQRAGDFLVRNLRSHARKSLLGDVAQFPVVEKRMTQKGARSEIDERNNVSAHGEKKKKSGRVTTKRKVGESLKESEIEGHWRNSGKPGKANESTEGHSQQGKAMRRSKRNVPRDAGSVQTDAAVQKDEIVKGRELSKNKILVVDSAAENVAVFHNGTVFSKEKVAKNTTGNENELEVAHELQGQSKCPASSNFEVTISSSKRNGCRKRHRDMAAQDGAGEEVKRSNCPISSNHQARRIAKVSEEQGRGNAMSTCEEAAEIPTIEKDVATESGNLPTDYTDGGMAIPVDGLVMADDNLITAEVMEVRMETKTLEELDYSSIKFADVKDSTIAVSACKGDKEISGAVNATIFGQANSDVVEMAQTQEADVDVASEGTGAISSADKVNVNVTIAGDSLKCHQEMGDEEFVRMKGIGDGLKSDSEETPSEAQEISEFATVSHASCVRNISNINLNDDIVPDVSKAVDELETTGRLSLGEQIFLGDAGVALFIHCSPENEECTIEHHAVFDRKDQLEFTEGNDQFIKMVHGDCNSTSNENGITQGDSEVTDHVCIQEETLCSNETYNAVLEGLKETAMPELGSIELQKFHSGSRNSDSVSEQANTKAGKENGNDTTDGDEDTQEENAFLNEVSRDEYESTPTVTDPCFAKRGGKIGDNNCRALSEEFQEAPKTVTQDASLGCKTGVELKDGTKEVEERDVETMDDNGGDVDEKGSAEILGKCKSDERFRNCVASTELSDEVEECETIENLSSGQEIYPGGNGHGAVELVSGGFKDISNEDGITQGKAEESALEDAQEENAFSNKISGVEFGNIHTTSEQCDTQGGEEESGVDAKEICRIVSKEFQESAETITEGAHGSCKIVTELKKINEVEKRDLEAAEDNAVDMNDHENAGMKSLASPNYVKTVEELEAIEKPSSGRWIYLSDALAFFTQITPVRVNNCDLLKKEKDPSEAGDRFAETVTQDFVNREFEVIPMVNGIAQGKSEETSHEEAEEEHGFLNENVSGETDISELSSMKPLEVLKQCSTFTVPEWDAKGAEVNGDDAKETLGVVSVKLQHKVSATFTEVADQECEVHVKDHSENIKKSNANAVEVTQEDVDEKDNAGTLIHQFGDDERPENSVSDGHQRFEETGGTAEKAAFGVCAFSPISTPKPQGSLARNDKMSLCRQIILLEKYEHGDDDKEIHVGGTNYFCECNVRDDATMSGCGNVVTAKETEDESSLNCAEADANWEQAQEISGQNENNSSLHEELREASDAAMNENEHNENAVVQPAVEKLEYEHDKIGEVQVEGMNHEEGKIPENINEECIGAFTMDQELHKEVDHEEIEKRENADHKTKNLCCKFEEAICLKHEEHMDVQGAEKTTVAMFASGTTFPTSMNVPECQGIDQEEVLIPDKFGSEQYFKKGSDNYLPKTMIAVEPVEYESPVKCEAAQMRSKEPQEISKAKENESSQHKEYEKPSNLEDASIEFQNTSEVTAHFAPEKLDCKDNPEIAENGSDESILEESGCISFEEVRVNVDQKQDFSCSCAQVVQENECVWAIGKELELKVLNLFDKEMAYIRGDELKYDTWKQINEREDVDKEKESADCEESEDADPLKHEDLLNVQEIQEKYADFHAPSTVYLTPHDDAEHQASGQNAGEQLFNQMLPIDHNKGDSREIQVTVLLDKLSSESTDCISDSHDSDGKQSLAEEVEAARVSTGEEEQLLVNHVAEIPEFFGAKDAMDDKGSSELGKESEDREEGLVNDNLRENLDSKAMSQFTEKEIADFMEGKYDTDDTKDVTSDEEKMEVSAQKFGSDGSEGVTLPTVALIPSPVEGLKNPTEFAELNLVERSSSLQHELGGDNSYAPFISLEHQSKGLNVLGNEHRRDLAFKVDAANIRSPVTDSSNRSTESYSRKRHGHDGQDENGYSCSSFSEKMQNTDADHEVMSNMIGSGNFEAPDMWTSTVQAEKRVCRIPSHTSKSIESLNHWPSSSEMKENTPVLKQGQFNNRSLGKSAMSAHKRRALQDLQTVKEL